MTCRQPAGRVMMTTRLGRCLVLLLYLIAAIVATALFSGGGYAVGDWFYGRGLWPIGAVLHLEALAALLGGAFMSIVLLFQVLRTLVIGEKAWE
jgi:hypothetical protein